MYIIFFRNLDRNYIEIKKLLRAHILWKWHDKMTQDKTEFM